MEIQRCLTSLREKWLVSCAGSAYGSLFGPGIYLAESCAILKVGAAVLHGLLVIGPSKSRALRGSLCLNWQNDANKCLLNILNFPPAD